MDLGKRPDGPSERRATSPGGPDPSAAQAQEQAAAAAAQAPTAAQPSADWAPTFPRPAGQPLLGPGGVGGVPVRRSPGLVSLNLRYYAIRAALFGGFLTVLIFVLHIDGLLAFALAVVASGLLSFPLAMRQRRAGVDAIEVRRDGRR